MNVAVSQQVDYFGPFGQLSVHYDEKLECIWYKMHAVPRPCFTTNLLAEIALLQDQVSQAIRRNDLKISYLVLASDVPGVFNLGGDLNSFRQHIEQHDRQALLNYARACIDVLYFNAAHLHLPITTISLVQGSALGGGFEAAMSSSLLIAEKGCELGLPEILFNLFPGMGAYSLLSRKLDFNRAEALMTAGKLFSAEELYEMGVVDLLAEPGEGVETVQLTIRKHSRSKNGLHAIRQVREYLNPLSYEELMDIAEIWVDAALNLTSRDLRMMSKLVGAQNRLKPSVLVKAVS